MRKELFHAWAAARAAAKQSRADAAQLALIAAIHTHRQEADRCLEAASQALNRLRAAQRELACHITEPQ